MVHVNITLKRLKLNKSGEIVMAWVCVNSFGTELIFETEPHKSVYSWRDDYGSCKCIELPKGSIKNLIGIELTWNDEPVELR